MGREKMQGSPWHYEYLHPKKKKRNSINCVYNNGVQCSCKISKNHGKKCVGENNCGEFERCSFHRPEIYSAGRSTKNINNEIKYKKPQKNNYNPKVTVEKGNSICVSSFATSEIIEIHISDVKNPFYMKQLDEIVSIKGEKYKIVKIEK